MKIFTILATSVIAAAILGGCAMINRFVQSDESVRDEMLQHLYQKYGVEFIADSLERGSHDFLVAIPVNGDPDTDWAGVQRHVRDGEVEFRDTYFGVVIREELEGSISDALSDIDLPMKVFFSTNTVVYDNKFDGTKSFADFNQWVAEGNPFRLTISIVLELNSIEESEFYANIIFEKMQETGLMLGVVLNFAPVDIFEQVTRTNHREILLLPRSRGDITTIINDKIN